MLSIVIQSGVTLALGMCVLEAAHDADPVGAITVRSPAEFRQAVARAKPGARILLATGQYGGGYYFSGVSGSPEKPIVIGAADPAHRPVFNSGGTAIHFSASSNLELHDLVVAKMSDNGINIDDGGKYDMPARNIVLKGLTVMDIGPGGNHDGIKLSGIDDFHVQDCTIERWGTGGGSAIDMVGCHNGVIETSVFRHSDESDSTGIQAKGGCSRLKLRGNRFESAGGRAVNIGGSTGLEFFRPPLNSLTGKPWSEAKDIVVEGNTFVGSGAPVAYVGVDGATVRFNTIYCPKRWAARILQETTAPGFVPSRNGAFTDNVIVFRSADWGGAVNIGPKTAPETFRFARNVWYCLDAPDRSRPALPTAEVGGIYGVDPQLRDAPRGDLRLKPGSPASGRGSEAAPGRGVK